MTIKKTQIYINIWVCPVPFRQTHMLHSWVHRREKQAALSLILLLYAWRTPSRFVTTYWDLPL